MIMNKLFLTRTFLKQGLRRSSSLSTSTAENEIPKRQTRKPFIKNLLAGKFNEEFLIYPELTGEDVKQVENKFLCLPKNPSNYKESLNQVVEVSKSSPGLDNSSNSANTYCELTRLSEAVSTPSIALLSQIHNICVQDIIKKYGTEDQKQKYLPSLLNCEKTVGFAMCEEISGSDPAKLETLAVRELQGTEWIINGVKTWVTNAENADLFLVFSKHKLHKSSPGTTDLTVFLIERNTPGISFEKIESYGLEDCGIGKVNLNEVQLTNDNILGEIGKGYIMAVELIGSYKYSFASYFSSQLKSLLNDAVKFINPRKQSLVDLKDCESIRMKVSDVLLTIYMLDSMLYLTAGIKDNFDVDLSIESAIIHLFCIQRGMEAVEKCLELLGSKVFDKSLPYYKIHRDLKAASNSLFSKEICKLFIALGGIQEAAIIKKDDILKLRNSFDYPAHFFKNILRNMRQNRDSPKLNLKLYSNLHPSLKNCCDQLEYCVIRLQYCVDMLLIRHGAEISNRQLDLERIADILVDIYSMTAALGRSSRSYCTGIKFAEDELFLVKTLCNDAYNRCKFTFNSILNDEVILNDLLHFRIAGHLFQHGSYYIEHPLTQNIA